jgi:hypothetical protein
VARRVGILVVLALLAAGCGARSNKPFTAKATASCLPQKGFKQVTTNPAKVGFIAAFAENGGIRATAADGNVLTIAFASDEAGAASTRRAFKAHASPFYRRRIDDILESQRNAVLVWTTSPTQQQISDAESCLAP